MSTIVKNVIDVRNPRTGKIDYHIQAPSNEEIVGICQTLRENQENWNSMGIKGRIQVMEKWKKSLEESREELLTAVTNDTGRLGESIREVDNVSKWIDCWSQLALEQLESHSQKTSIFSIHVESDYSPYPLVGVISPWNFPFSLSLMDAIPALIAGCSVMVKPSEVTPRFIYPLMKTIERVPELSKVLKYVTGAGETGATIIDYVDMVCFTGSVATGRKVAVKAAERFIPAFLELGGKDPAIIVKSADLERAASAILVGSVFGAGQQCYSVERIFVEESILEDFVKILTYKANQLKLANPNPDSGEIGPIIFEKQANIIKEQLEDAVDKGAIIQCGGEVEEINGGLWCRPTVVTGLTQEMKLMKEETFGPIMPIIPFSNVEEAIRMANDSEYGLSGAVFAGTVEEAAKIARSLNVGGISINDTGLSPFFIGDKINMEKSAFNYSGLGGSRLGSSSIQRFVRKKILFCNNSNQPSQWWYN